LALTTSVGGADRVGIASVPISFEDWAQRDPALVAAFARFAQQHGLDFLLVMTQLSAASSSSSPSSPPVSSGSLQRQLAAFRSSDADARVWQQLLAHLERSDLALRRLDLPLAATAGVSEESLRFWSQGNVAASRKQIFPLVQAFFSSATPSL
jgi:hypothetical protein